MGLSSIELKFETPPLGRSHRVYSSFRNCTQLRFW